MLRWMLALACCFHFLLPAVSQTADVISGTAPKEPLGDLNAGRPLPKGTLVRLGSPRMRSRSDYSHGIQFSPNGKFLVLAASRDDLWWFDLDTGKTVYQADYPVGGIQCGRLLDDGSLLFFHSKSESDNTRHFLTRFDPKTAKVVSESKVEIASVDQSEIDRPGETLFVLRDKLLLVTDTKTGEKLWSETLKQKPNGPPAFTPDGTKLIVGTETSIRMLDAKTGQTIRELDRPAEAKNGAGVSGLVASADNRWIAGVVHQECVVVWDTQTGRLKPTIAKQKLPLGFTPNGRLFSVAQTGTVGIWNVETGQREREFPIPVADRACLSADGKRIASRIHDCVTLHEIPETGEPKLSSLSAELPGLPDEMHFAPDGALVGRLSEWGGWAVWTNREPKLQLLRPPGSDSVIGLCAGQRHVLTATPKHFIVSNLEGASPAKFRYDLSNSNTRRLAAMSGDGRLVAAVHDLGLARYDMGTRTEQVLRSRVVNRSAGSVAAISADGRLAATEGYHPVSNTWHVELFSLATNRSLREFSLRGTAERMAFTPDGRRLGIVFLSSSRDGDQQKNLTVVEPESGRELLNLGPSANGSGPRLALSPDGRTAAWAVEGEVRIYELMTGQVRAKLPTPNNDVHSLALAGDGRTLAVAGPGWPVTLWDPIGDTEPTAPAAGEWDALWSDLAGTDATVAYRAVRRMQRRPNEAVAFLRGKMVPAAPPEPATLAKAIAALDAPAFADRQQASKDLRAFGELAIPELTRVLEATESAEVRQRIEALLKLGHKPTPAAIRAVRAVELLDGLQSHESKALLRILAGGADGALQTREAIAAVGRTR